MKIIENNIKEDNLSLEEFKSELIFPFEVTCEECESVLEIQNLSDMIFERNTITINCPCCSHENKYTPDKLYEIMEDTLRDWHLSELKYPECFDDHKDAVGLTDEEINNNIDRIKKYLQGNPDESFLFIESGDSFVCGFNRNEDNEYYFIVARKYHDAYAMPD